MAFIIEEEKFDNFLIEHNLSLNEYYVLWKLTRKLHKDEVDKMKDIYRLCDGIKHKKKGVKSKHTKLITNDSILELEEEKYLNPVLFKSDFPDTHDVTEKFYKELFIETRLAFDQLYTAFPDFLMIEGKRINSKACDMDELLRIYKRKIGNSLIYHDKILRELAKQIELDLVNMKLDKWIMGECWRLDTINKPLESKVKAYGENL